MLRSLLVATMVVLGACTLNPDGSITVAGCSASSCAGCCQFGVCLGGDQPEACGVGGAFCDDCRSNSRTCLADRTCGIDGSVRLRVYVSSARVAANDNGQQWDSDGSAPDVRVTLRCPTLPATTVVQSERQSLFPVWTSGGCNATAADYLARQMSFTLDDVDPVVDDSMTSYLVVPITQDIIGSAEAYGAADFEVGPSGAMLGTTFRVEVVTK
jgi:hypothetical protein